MKSGKKSLYKCASVTLAILITTFYLAFYELLPINILPLHPTAGIIILLASIYMGRFWTKGYVKHLKITSAIVLFFVVVLLVISSLFDIIWGYSNDLKYLVYLCLYPTLFGVMTALYWGRMWSFINDVFESIDEDKDKEDNETKIEAEEEIDTDINDNSETEDSDIDPLIDDVVKHFVENNVCSIATIQREFEVGYNRATRIMNQLEQAGVVTPPQPPRQMLVDNIEAAEQKILALREDREEADE